MIDYTYDELERALGPAFELVACGDKSQARIQSSDGCDMAFIDLDIGRIEASLDVKWYAAADSAPEGFPDAPAIAAARQAIASQLEPEWRAEGFAVPEEGSVAWYWFARDPQTKLPMYRLDVAKEVPALEVAVQTIRWISSAETEIWV